MIIYSKNNEGRRESEHVYVFSCYLENSVTLIIYRDVQVNILTLRCPKVVIVLIKLCLMNIIDLETW